MGDGFFGFVLLLLGLTFLLLGITIYIYRNRLSRFGRGAVGVEGSTIVDLVIAVTCSWLWLELGMLCIFYILYFLVLAFCSFCTVHIYHLRLPAILLLGVLAREDYTTLAAVATPSLQRSLLCSVAGLYSTITASSNLLILVPS